MTVTKITYDEQYPYIIEDGWDNEIYATKEDLIALKKEIEKVLKAEKKGN